MGRCRWNDVLVFAGAQDRRSLTAGYWGRHACWLAGVLMIGVTSLLFAGESAPATAPSRQRDDLAVMTFNIRYVNDQDGPNGWAFRKALVLQTIRDFNPDLLGTQEVKPEQLAFLHEQLGKNYIVVAGKPANATPFGEHQAIFARKDRFELIEHGQFWLSETPDKPGSRGWDANLPRSVVWARLKDVKRDGATILFLNTHWDHLGEQARQQSGKLVRQWIANNANESSVILTGDFNADADSKAYENLFAKPASGG